MNQVAVQFSFPRMVTLLPRVDCRVLEVVYSTNRSRKKPPCACCPYLMRSVIGPRGTDLYTIAILSRDLSSLWYMYYYVLYT